MRDIKKEMATAQSDAEFAKESEQYYKEQATRLLDMGAYTAAANAAELAGKHRDEYQKNRILYLHSLVKNTDHLVGRYWMRNKHAVDNQEGGVK